MTHRELDAAGIHDPGLRAAYAQCRQVNAAHGRTYFLATAMLSPAQRPAIHALYAFARRLDDIVDEPPPEVTPEMLGARLTEAESVLSAGLGSGTNPDPLLRAVIDTVARYAIPAEYFSAFFRSMRLDLTKTEYRNRTELNTYVHGSAEVIGLQVLPVLGTAASREDAAPRAAALGKAFQLTNFLRDVAEDLGRGRVYLPADELAAFGVDRELLTWCAARRKVEPRVRRALADQIATTRAVYQLAAPGVAMLHPASRPCVATALTLYSRILDRLEEQDLDVFAGRAAVSRRRRLTIAAGALTRAMWARRRHGSPVVPSLAEVS